jgi:dTDP-glucose 4,6-dehydratase
MQTVLVAGGAGFIGSHLCTSLLQKNYKVICVDNFITSDKKNIEPLLNNQNFVFLERDVTKSLDLSEKIDYIFHLASPASPNKKSPRSYINFPLETLIANSQGTHELLDLAKKNNSKFLYASTSEVYGDPEISPQKESYFGNVNPNGVRSVYDEGKRFGEAITMAYLRKFDIDIRIIRIFNTYGPSMQKDDGRVISNFINQAMSNSPITIYGDGSQTRSCCFVVIW